MYQPSSSSLAGSPHFTRLSLSLSAGGATARVRLGPEPARRVGVTRICAGVSFAPAGGLDEADGGFFLLATVTPRSLGNVS